MYVLHFQVIQLLRRCSYFLVIWYNRFYKNRCRDVQIRLISLKYLYTCNISWSHIWYTQFPPAVVCGLGVVNDYETSTRLVLESILYTCSKEICSREDVKILLIYGRNLLYIGNLLSECIYNEDCARVGQSLYQMINTKAYVRIFSNEAVSSAITWLLFITLVRFPQSFLYITVYYVYYSILRILRYITYIICILRKRLLFLAEQPSYPWL